MYGLCLGVELLRITSLLVFFFPAQSWHSEGVPRWLSNSNHSASWRGVTAAHLWFFCSRNWELKQCWESCAGRPVLADDLIRFDLIASDSLGRKSGVATSLPAHCRALQKGVKNVGKTQATRGLHLAMCRRAGDLAALNVFERPHLKTIWCPRHINIHQLPSIRGGPCFVVEQYPVYIFDWKEPFPRLIPSPALLTQKHLKDWEVMLRTQRHLIPWYVLIRLDTSWCCTVVPRYAEKAQKQLCLDQSRSGMVKLSSSCCTSEGTAQARSFDVLNLTLANSKVSLARGFSPNWSISESALLLWHT